MEPSQSAISQYCTTSDKLALRAAILSYDTNPQKWYSWLESRLGVVCDVLEVGAGTGELWRHVNTSQATLALTDFSSAMCERLRALEIPQAIVKQCDASDLPFSDNTFDLVIANHMLYHLDDPEAALKEFARVLRKGGRLRASLNGRDHIEELLALGQAVGRPSPIVGAARITAETAPGLISKYFHDVTVERFPGEFVVPGPEPILGYLASWDEAPMSAAQEVDARVVVQDTINREGSFRVKKHMVLFSATKA